MKALVKISVSAMLLASFIFLDSCKKKADPDPYAFLAGTWAYANGAECVYVPESKTARGTKVPTGNIDYGFVVGEDYWRNVESTGSDRWEYEQIVRYSDKVKIEYRKSTFVKKDENTLTINTPNLTDTELKRVKR